MWRIIEVNPNYEISDCGEVRNITTGKHVKTHSDKYGYNKVWLSFGRKYNVKPFTVHRLVALAFIDNPNDYPLVHHVNHNRADNRAENLEWCTEKYNIQEAKGCKIIVAKDGNIVGEYPSIRNAAADLGLSDTMIGYCLHGRYKSAKGYTFEYAK